MTVIIHNLAPSDDFEVCTVVSINGSRFAAATQSYTVTCKQDLFPETLSNPEFSSKPGTVIDLGSRKAITEKWLQQIVCSFLKRDDVYNEGFLASVMFQNGEGSIPVLEDDARLLLLSWGSTSCHLIVTEHRVPDGPYLMCETGLRKVFKLYDDPYGAFMYGILETEEGSGRYQRYVPGLIPVPSRLYFDLPTNDRPLNGKRIAIKDIFHISGLPTSASCKVFEDYYGERVVTASSVRKLVDRGAVLVGKTKTAQFACGEPSPYWIDYQCPFNPRGDGYQTPAGSSSGSAVGIAAYEWLDFGIGTDTLGSITSPANACGIYGVRPTHGSLGLDGIIQVSRHFDTPGYFSRSIEDLQIFGLAWYGSHRSPGQSRIKQVTESCSLPPSTTCRGFGNKVFFPVSSFSGLPAMKLQQIRGFASDIKRVIGSTNHDLDISAMWDNNRPVGVYAPLNDFLKNSLANIQLYDCYHNNAQFRSDFRRDKNHDPYVNPLIRLKWDLGRNITYQQYQEARKRQKIFKNFLLEHVFLDGNIMLLPGGRPHAKYRDEYQGSPEQCVKEFQGFGFSTRAISILGGLPEVLIPIDQYHVQSPVTNEATIEPVNVRLVGPPDSDGQLIELILKVLKESGRPLEVRVGKNVF